MSAKLTFPIVCISESELLQWVARGRIHLLRERALGDSVQDKKSDISMFAACPALKLDDAKGRVWVSLSQEVLNGSRVHPYAQSKSILDLPITDITAIGSILPQYRRRLESIPLPISEETMEDEWNAWLITQGAYERYCEIENVFKKIGFRIADGLNIESVKMAMRPHEDHDTALTNGSEWKKLISHRDELLQKLRFEGHAGEKSFLKASVQYMLALMSCDAHTAQDFDLAKNEGTWSLEDVDLNLCRAMSEIDQATNASLPIFVKAAYLRCFDDLHYGTKDWPSTFNLIRFVKYSISEQLGSELLFFLLSSTTTEEMISKNLSAQF